MPTEMWTPHPVRYLARQGRRRTALERLRLTAASLLPFRGVRDDDSIGLRWYPHVAGRYVQEVGEPVFPGEPGYEQAPFELGFLGESDWLRRLMIPGGALPTQNRPWAYSPIHYTRCPSDSPKDS